MGDKISFKEKEGSKAIGPGNPKIPIIKRFLPRGIHERRQKGVCFSCDEKFELGHKCKRLFFLDTYSAEELEDAIEEQSEEVVTELRELEISLRELIWNLTGDTIRILARLEGVQVIILLDTGSSHNFVSKQVVNQRMLSPSRADQIKVRIASGKNPMGFVKKSLFMYKILCLPLTSVS